jgi:hypothetical protein
VDLVVGEVLPCAFAVREERHLAQEAHQARWIHELECRAAERAPVRAYGLDRGVAHVRKVFSPPLRVSHSLRSVAMSERVEEPVQIASGRSPRVWSGPAPASANALRTSGRVELGMMREAAQQATDERLFYEFRDSHDDCVVFPELNEDLPFEEYARPLQRASERRLRRQRGSIRSGHPRMRESSPEKGSHGRRDRDGLTVGAGNSPHRAARWDQPLHAGDDSCMRRGTRRLTVDAEPTVFDQSTGPRRRTNLSFAEDAGYARANPKSD